MASPYAAYVEDEEIVEHAPSVVRLTRDLAQASRTMGAQEARFLVDTYYTFQDNRKRAGNQIKAMQRRAEAQGLQAPEPHVLIDWMFDQSKILESQIKRAADQYTQAHIMGSWMRQIVGIGPVISAGLLANLEVPRAHAGHIYAFAGIAGDGQKEWLPNTKRPYSTRLKTVCWHAGQSFMKLAAHTDKSGKPDCFYGLMYRERKAFEQKMSDEGHRHEAAAKWIKRMKDKTTPTYKIYLEGKLPPSQIDARARRYAVKMFLSHMNDVWHIRLGNPPPAPYAIARAGHVDYIPPPVPA